MRNALTTALTLLDPGLVDLAIAEATVVSPILGATLRRLAAARDYESILVALDDLASPND